MSEPSDPLAPGPHGSPAVADTYDRDAGPAHRVPSDLPEYGAGEPPAEAVTVHTAAPAQPAPPARFVQLTYTSFDPDGGHGGGWRVHRTTGDPTPEEQQALVARIPTHTGIRDAGSGYLTAAQVAALPRRLVHGPVRPGSGAALWHSVAAGVDASSRPGNVFAHVLLDRAPESPSPAVRPTDLLGSPAWLCPFGPEQVAATTLDTVPDPPWPPGPAAGHDAVAESLAEETLHRRALVTVLVDAVSGAMRTGAFTVALVTGDPRRAEQWIVALGRVMSAGTARRFFWATEDVRGGPAGADGTRPHLVVVDPQAAEGLGPDTGYLVVRDVLSEQEPGDAAAEVGSTRTGEGHRTRDGVPVEVTAWSVLVTEVASLDPPSAVARVLARADDIAYRVGDPPGLGHAWPLAAACLDDPVLPDAQEDVLTVLTSEDPPGLAGYPELRARIRDLVDGTVGRTPQEALACAESGGGPYGVLPGRACARYVELALLDRDWLVRRDPLPLPPDAHGHLSSDIGQTARAAIDQLLERAHDPRTPADPTGIESAVAVMRVIELVREYRIADPRFGVEQGLELLAERVVAPVLLDPVRGLQLARWIGRRPEPTVRTVREAVDRVMRLGTRGPGDEIVTGVHRWLHPDPPEPPAPGSLAAAFASLSPTYVELALQATAVVARPQDHVTVALWARLGEGRVQWTEVRRLAGAHDWTAPELREFAAQFDLGPLAPQLRPWVLRLPWDDHLAAASRDVETRMMRSRTRPGDEQQQLLDAVRFRVEAQRWTRGPAHGGYARSVERFLDAAERILPLSAPHELAPEAMASLQAATVVDVMNGGVGPVRATLAAWTATEALLNADRAVADLLHQAIDLGVVDEERFAFAALVIRTRLSVPELVDLSDLAALTLPGGEPVVSRVLLERLRVPGRDPSELLGGTEEFAEFMLQGNLPPREADDAFTVLRRECQHLRRAVAGKPDDDDTRPRRRTWRPF